MFRPEHHVTFLPDDPARQSLVACWPDDSSPDQVDLILPTEDGVPRRVTVQARLLPLREVLDQLVALHPDVAASRSTTAWAHAARVAMALIARGRLQLGSSPTGSDMWRLGPLSAAEVQLRSALAEWLPPEAHATPAGHDDDYVAAPAAVLTQFFDAIADLMPRTAAAPTFGQSPTFCSAESAHITNVTGVFPDERPRATLQLRLHPPIGEGQFRIELQLRSAVDRTVVADAAALWAGDAPGFGADAEEDLLVALRQGARRWPPLVPLLQQPCPSELVLDDAAALDLMGPAVRTLAAAGIEVLAPLELSRRLRTTARIGAPNGFGNDGPRRFSLGDLCDLTYRPTLDGEPLTDEELAQLAEAQRPLVRLRGEWVVIDPAVIERINKPERINVGDVLAAVLSGELVMNGETMALEVADVLSDLADRLRLANGPHERDEPAGLTTKLRPYQRRGLAWLAEMTDLRFGGVLADDMGLGKTVQVIALHAQRAAFPNLGPMLVVCPASVVTNWEREFARFAPDVTVRRYHGPDRSLSSVTDGEVVVTTYGLVRRDHHLLRTQPWGLVVADEAQNIKNAHTAVARALRDIPADARLALTGTPIENRVTDLWSLLDWTTPGLLGSLEQFRRNVAVPIERDRDQDAARRLARLTSPFVLRRRKDDPDVAPDLPPKIETDHPVTLSPEQAGLYRAVVDRRMGDIRDAAGMARRGLVLQLLTELKQVCNHPAQYQRETGPLEGRSGKLDATLELLASIAEADDAALVFTQYVRMGDLLGAALDRAGIASRFLHGKLTLNQRERLVEDFQSGAFPVFIVSLRAGGTGLNLTRANHVVHYDRWWNPAVEQQASDRAWRIGQTQTVQIHRLLSQGTLEERIAEVLAEKEAIAESVVGSGEGWITELTTDELADLVQLGAM